MPADQNVNVNFKVTITGIEWLEPLVRRIIWKLDKMGKTQDEIIAEQQAQKAQIEKIGGETRSLLDKVQELLDKIAALENGEVKQELADATKAVSDQLQIVDDLVPDAPAP